MPEHIINQGGIPWRARPANGAEETEEGRLWFFEYQVLPDREWRPRGSFREKDGVYIYQGTEYRTPEDALRARRNNGL